MEKYLTICHDMTGRYYIINLYGDIVVSGETSIDVIEEYCRKYDCTPLELGKVCNVDGSKMIYDERGYYWTENILEEEFNADTEKLDIYSTFSVYIAEICGKNGSCEFI